MKILALNCPNLDLSYFSKRGLKLEVEYQPLTKVFPSKFLYENTTEQGEKVPLYTPDVEEYLKTVKTDADFILVGWNPIDYGTEFSRTGGYTCPNALPNGAYYSTVRIDSSTSKYAVHEIHHLLCDFLIFSMGKVDTVHDYMDKTPINGVIKPYYKNDDPNAIDGNHALTWATIAPYTSILNLPRVTITRFRSNIHETLGDLVAKNNGMTFTCKTLELADRDNAPNISCIPKGTYTVKFTRSFKFPFGSYEVQSVPRRSGIRFHSGNFAYKVSGNSDIQGCILLGDVYNDINGDGELDIINSRVTVSAFEKFMNKQPYILIIK